MPGSITQFLGWNKEILIKVLPPHYVAQGSFASKDEKMKGAYFHGTSRLGRAFQFVPVQDQSGMKSNIVGIESPVDESKGGKLFSPK